MTALEEVNVGEMRRFDRKSHEEYQTWRKWAKAYLSSLPATTEATTMAPTLFQLLDGEAVEAFEQVEIEESAVEDGVAKFFEVLDALCPLRTAPDRKIGAHGITDNEEATRPALLQTSICRYTSSRIE